MLTIQISVSKSWTLTKKKKTLFHYLFSTIALAAFCEWFGIYLQGTGTNTRPLHIIVKAIELSVAPMIGFLIAWLIEEQKPRFVFILIGLHAVAECLSGVFGYIYTIDADNVYRHGEFYWIYMVMYLLSCIYAVSVIIRNVKKYQYGGIAYFMGILIFMVGGIVIQLIDSTLKVDYVVLALTTIMLYVFTLEMIQQTDQLTELINRRGYENYISHIDEPCIILFFDIDRFKEANDRYGHTFGDACIAQTGKLIKKIYAKYGKCFRFGGDEFCAVLRDNPAQLESLNARFMEAMEQQRQKEKRFPTVSIGYAYYDPENGDIIKTLEEADKKMYEYKEAHRS